MKLNLLVFSVILILSACGGGGSKKQDPPPAVADPVKAVLTLPLQNQVCTSGTVISASQSSITFSWNKSDNADKYSLTVTNLLTAESSTQETQNLTISKSIARNTPFSWYVTSIASKTGKSVQSDTWKFYNSGPGVITYAPYPAEIISPAYAEQVTTATVDFTWKGSSPTAGANLTYDVYFGADKSSLSLLRAGLTDAFIKGFAVKSNYTFYWKVITKDQAGNTSDSGLQQFTTK